jgi:hypothetical protein
MVATTKIADFAEALAEKQHDLSADTIMIALTNTAYASEASNPTATGNGILANVTPISYTNYADSLTVDRTLEGVTSDESGGTYTFDAADFSISASGGALATFQYIYIYNDTSATPADQLIVAIDLETPIALTDGSSININFNASGIVTVA